MDNNARFSLQLSVKQIFLSGVAVGVLAAAALGFVTVLAKGGSFSGMFGGSGTGRAIPSGAVAADPSADPSAAPAVGTVKAVENDEHIRGDKNAPITLVEYSDFQCPFCSRFHPTMVQLMDKYKGKIRWVYRHFPLSSIHPYAEKAAEASECASEQGKFWEMADTFFSTQDSWAATGLDAAKLESIAKQAGVRDLKKFNDCVSSGKYASLVQSDQASGEAAGVTGTPGTIILGKNGEKQLIPGALPYEAVAQMIDALLAS